MTEQLFCLPKGDKKPYTGGGGEGGKTWPGERRVWGRPPAVSLKLEAWRGQGMSLGTTVQRRPAASLLMFGPGNCKPV